MNPRRLAIWWIGMKDVRAIALFPDDLSARLRALVNDALGRNGRGRLWADDEVPLQAVDAWPKTAMGERCAWSAGLVITPAEASQLRDYPGVITDLRLQRWEVFSA